MPAPPDSKIKMLALHIAIGGTVRAWCTETKVPTRTAYEWTRKPSFQALVDRHRARLVDMTLARLTNASCRAVAALEKIMRPSSEAKDSDVINAAKAILQSRNELSELADVPGRLAQLETGGTRRSKRK